MDAALQDIARIHDDLACRSVSDRSFKKPVFDEKDPYQWDRLIRTLVLAGFGNYEAAANASLVDAAAFLFLADDKHARIMRWLNS